MLFLTLMEQHNVVLKMLISEKINWKKPISCHLYPVRVTNYSEFSAVNYHKWEICGSACNLGDDLKIPIYKFVKEALIRKFGKKWYTNWNLLQKRIIS